MCWLCGNNEHSWGAVGAPRAEAVEFTGPSSGAKASFGLDAIVTQLQTSWGGSYENDTYPLANSTVYYALLTSAPLDSSSENAGWQAMTGLMVARAAEAFELWDDLVSISLNQYAGNPPNDAAVIQFGYSSATGGGTYEFPELGNYAGTNSFGGDRWNITRAEIWLNSSWSTHSTSSAINQAGYGYYGGYGFITYLHEIGHALGLSHPGSYNAGNGTITYSNSAEYAQDTRRYSIMSYFDANEDGSGTDHYASTGSWKYAQTPMLHDIAAAQAIYGADTTTRVGNTTYGFNSTAGKDVYDFTKNTSPILTIYDAGGIDTLDLSGFGGGQYGGQVINLNPGTYSNVGGYMTNNLAIAYTATIENAIGGSGNDTITGNTVANVLTGNSGNDKLYGGDGNDTLIGGLGTDSLYGEGGADTFLFTGPNQGADTIFDFGASDKIALQGSAFGGLAAGSLAAAGVNFSFGSAATAAGPSLFLDRATNSLYWDADGTGAGAATKIAQFDGAGNSGVIGTVGADWVFETGGDFDKNGTSDALWHDVVTGEVGAWMMGANGIKSWSAMGNVGGDWQVEASGDFDGNGTTDVLWRNTVTNQTGAWLMENGQPTGWLNLGAVHGNWVVKGTGDFDSNGIDDILWENSVSKVAGAWLMSDGIPGGWLNLGVVAAGWQIEGVGDLNGDGTDDVLFHNTVTGAAGAWRIEGGQAVGWYSYGTIGANWSFEAVADLNSDGTDDLYLHDAASGANGAWLMKNGLVAGWSEQPTFDSSWSLVGSGQFNGGGGEDLLWRNTVDGSVVANAPGISSSQFIIV